MVTPLGRDQIVPGVDADCAQTNSSCRKRSVERNSAKAKQNAKRIRKEGPKYSNAYRQLLNDQILEATTTQLFEGHSAPLKESQIGASVWTSKEKELFFNALPRLGKRNAKGIAIRIGSKSEIEVLFYLAALDKAYRARRLQRNGKLLKFLEIPAAFEIGEQCCCMLEDFADGLAYRQEKYEQKIETAKWDLKGHESTIDSSYLCKETQSRDGESSVAEDTNPFELFHIKKWLLLLSISNSSQGHGDSHIQCAFLDEAPSLRATATADLLGLVQSVTRRLIATTHFNTMCRERSTMSQRTRTKAVCKEDVLAAIKLLGMPVKWDLNAWLANAERCQGQIDASDMRRDQSEGINDNRNRDPSAQSTEDVNTKSDATESEISSELSISSKIQTSSLEEQTETSADGDESDPEGTEIYNHQVYNMHDEFHSLSEERRLYKLLNQPVPHQLQDISGRMPSRMPKHIKRSRSELDDDESLSNWYTNALDGPGEWEAFHLPTLEAKFADSARQVGNRIANLHGQSKVVASGARGHVAEIGDDEDQGLTSKGEEDDGDESEEEDNRDELQHGDEESGSMTSDDGLQGREGEKVSS